MPGDDDCSPPSSPWMERVRFVKSLNFAYNALQSAADYNLQSQFKMVNSFSQNRNEYSNQSDQMYIECFDDKHHLLKTNL